MHPRLITHASWAASRTTISRASMSAEMRPCGPMVTRPSLKLIEPWTSPSMYKSSRPRISPLITSDDIIKPPEGCTTSAVNPATLRTGSTRGGGGTSATGESGFGSSCLRHIGLSSSTGTPKLQAEGMYYTAQREWFTVPGERPRRAASVHRGR